MNVGELNTKLVIETASYADDNAGTPIPSWSTFLTCWVSLKASSSGESAESKQKVGKIVYDATTYSYAGVTQKMRGYMLSEYWDIESVHYEQTKLEMTLKLSKKDNQ